VKFLLNCVSWRGIK